MTIRWNIGHDAGTLWYIPFVEALLKATISDENKVKVPNDQSPKLILVHN